ncbi:unnamed protein product, partial [Laminaria digitata]
PLAFSYLRAVFEYVQDVVQKELPSCKIFPVGSFPLKTYLPCADVDMVMFLPTNASSDTVSAGSPGGEGELGAGSPGSEGGRSCELELVTTDRRGGGVTETSEETRTPALVSVNQALCMVAAQTGCRRGSTPQNRAWPHADENVKPEIRNVSFINARTPIVTMVVGNVVVDVTENQGGSVAASALLEEADMLIQQNHLFKRSLLLLKAWAWCETPRLVGKRVLGAQKGGLTSYGLSVMVLHLFSLRSSADDLVHPVDVFIRFFEVYSEFDWSRHCLTLDGPVAFDDIREHHPSGSAQGEDSARSRLRPLVNKVLEHLSPAQDKEKTVRVRGRPTGRFGRKSDSPDGTPHPVPAALGGAWVPATAHFPVRDCNIQDPLNALNNLGHSVTKSSLKALEHALQQGRQQLETFRLLPASPASFLPHNDAARRRPREPEVRYATGGGGGNETVGGGGDGSSSPVDYRVRGSGAKLDLPPQSAAPQMAAPQLAAPQLSAPQLAAPQAERRNSPPPLPNHVMPPMQFVRIPPMQAAHPGVVFGQPRPVLVRDAHQSATTREGQQQQQLLLAFPQPFLQAATPQRFQFMQQQQQQQQQQQAYRMPQGGSGGMLRPNSTVLVPAAPIHPEFLRQWNLQSMHRTAQGGFQPEAQFVPDQRNFVRADVLPADRGDQVAARQWAHANGMELEARPASAHRAEERHEQQRSNGNCRGGRRKRTEEGQGMKDSILPWDLLAFVNSSPTSSTASMSDYAEEGSKDDQDCHLLYESGVDDESKSVPAKEEDVFKAGNGGSANGDSTSTTGGGDRRQPKRAGGAGAGMKRARKASTSGSSSTTDRPTSGNLWGNWFLREFFADSCQLYASGDGFREDLLDHPCQRRSKLQERGSPPPRPADSPDILEGKSREMWSALESVGEMMRGAESQAMADGVEKVEPSEPGHGTGVEVGNGGGGGGGGGSGVGSEAELETRLLKPAVARGAGGGGGARPKLCASGDIGNGDRSQPRIGDADGSVLRTPPTQCRLPSAFWKRQQMAVDDETGYTTSEEQGDKEDGSPSINHGCVTGDACASPATADPPRTFSVCASTQTEGTLDAAPIPNVTATIDIGLQFECDAPEALDKEVQWEGAPPPTMVSRAVQFEGAGQKMASKGVQCAVETDGPCASQDVSPGTQCGPDTADSDSGGVERLRRVSEGAGETPPTVNNLLRGATRGDGGAEQNPPGNSERPTEQPNDSDDVPERELPQAVPGSRDANPPAAAVEPSTKPAVVDHGEGPPRSRKKRKKPKPGGAGASRPTAAVDGLHPPPDCSRKPVHGWRGRISWFWGAALFGVVGVVLAGAWATDWGRAGASAEGRDVVATAGAQPVREERAQAQPPVWVVAGSSITLGDVGEFERGAQRAEGVGRVQWVKDGAILPGQTR